jgi:hypothetical protein
VLNEALVQHELAMADLAFQGRKVTTDEGKSHMDDKSAEYVFRIEWLQTEIQICETKLGLTDAPQS